MESLELSEILKEVEMASFKGDMHKKSFENSHTVIFVFDNEKLIGFGRAISDGVYQAAIYDVAVLPKSLSEKSCCSECYPCTC